MLQFWQSVLDVACWTQPRVNLIFHFLPENLSTQVEAKPGDWLWMLMKSGLRYCDRVYCPYQPLIRFACANWDVCQYLYPQTRYIGSFSHLSIAYIESQTIQINQNVIYNRIDYNTNIVMKPALMSALCETENDCVLDAWIVLFGLCSLSVCERENGTIEKEKWDRKKI